MKNKLIDLNNHMFAQLERLSDEELTGDDLKVEIFRSKAIESLASQIIDNARLSLRAHELINGDMVRTAPEMLGLSFNES